MVNYFPQQNDGGIASTNFGNQCWDDTFYAGSSNRLNEHCPNLMGDILYCQQNTTKKILLSLGGGGAPTYQLTTATAGVAFATQLWQQYGPYNQTYVDAGGIRPLDGGYDMIHGDPQYAIDIDGFDFDIEVAPTGEI